MGLKNDIKFKILQELMQETNIERPISIWKLRDAVYGEISVEGDKEKKKNKRDNQIRTVKKDVFELEAEGIVTITANYAQTECQFRYCGTAIPFLTVRSTAR